MALFGFLKKKKEPAIPMPVKVPEPPRSDKEAPKLSERHHDDLEKELPIAEGPLFPEIPKLDLPELEPAQEQKEAKEIISSKKEENVPEHIPELEHIEVDIEIPDELPELEEISYGPPNKAKKSPIFINVDVYSEMIEKLNTTRAKLNEYASAAGRIEELRTRKEMAMEKWRNNLEDIERKLLLIDKILFEGES